MNIDMMDFLTDEQVEQIQKEIVKKITKTIQECDFDMTELIKTETEAIFEHIVQECDLDPAQSIVNDFMAKTLKKALK